MCGADTVRSLKENFTVQMPIYWANLGRTTNLLILLNISLFFVTELVAKQGYYYTYYSLMLLIFVKFGLLVPLGLLNRIWYYSIFLALETGAIYYLVASIWFWVQTSKV